MKRILITGANGFCGSHLTESLVKQGHSVHAIIRDRRSNLDFLSSVVEKLTLYYADITDPHAVKQVFDEANPDEVYHLAAQSHVPTSNQNPQSAIETNVVGTLNLLEAARSIKGSFCRILVVGSSDEYGLVKSDECPITEESPLRPQNPYGVSKVACDLLARQYAKSYGMSVVVSRAFNHSGPRRGICFAEASWAHRIAMIEAGLTDGDNRVFHGNLDAVRDYTHVEDIVRGYQLIVEKGKAGEVYQLCSGKNSAMTMRRVLDYLRSKSLVDIDACLDPGRNRPSDVPLIIGDSTKAKTELGWTPTIPATKMLDDLLEYFRSQIQKEKKVVETV